MKGKEFQPKPNPDRTAISSEINRSIVKTVKPWIRTESTDLPIVTVKDIARTAGISPEKTIDVLSRSPFVFSVNGSSFTATVGEPEFPNRRLTLNDARNYDLSAKRLAKAARYFSRPPGGGPAQKIGIQESKVSGIFRERARQRQRIVFELQVDNTDVQPELAIPEKATAKSPEEIIRAEPNGDLTLEVFNRLKKDGFGKNWVIGKNEVQFAEKLIKFAQGEPTDFIIWNCIGFKWIKDEKGGYPFCDITDNLKVAISLYFKDKITEIAEMLSAVGNPNISILLPSNEAFDTKVFKYNQTPEVRNGVLTNAVNGLNEEFSKITLPPNARIQAVRWDDFLEGRNASKTAEQYTEEGEIKLRASSKFSKIADEALKSSQAYFAGYGITGISPTEQLARQIRYYGIYVGEGIAKKELQEKGRNIIVFNFEEMRVGQLEFLGADGELAVITAITPDQMTNYYQDKKRKLALAT